MSANHERPSNSSMQAPIETPPAIPGSATEVGARLRSVRETRGLSVFDCAQMLKLPPRQVEAMEQGAFERLPGPAFVRGFLRNYARLLQLDPQPLLAALEQPQYSAAELSPAANTLGTLPSEGAVAARTTWPALAVSVVLLAIAVAGWYFDWFAPRDEIATSDVPVTAEVSAAPQAIDPAPLPTPVPASAPATAPGAPAAGETQSAAPASPPEVAPTGAAPATPGGSGTAEAAVPGMQRLSFSFSGESWVEVRDASGKVVFSRLNAPGSSQDVQGVAPFSLIVGNARAVSLRRNGEPVDLAPHTKVEVARFTLN